jgi:hypothetical protein
MNPKLQIVKLAYQDHACLDFCVNVSRPEAAKAARIIGRYNEFRPDRVIRFLRSLPPRTRLLIGREQSPVLYVLWYGFLSDADKADLLEKARAAELRADEIDLPKSNVRFRIWWD